MTHLQEKQVLSAIKVCFDTFDGIRKSDRTGLTAVKKPGAGFTLEGVETTKRAEESVCVRVCSCVCICNQRPTPARTPRCLGRC